MADIPPPNEPAWPAVTHVAFRTNIIALVYLVMSTIWILTSLMLIGEFSQPKSSVVHLNVAQLRKINTASNTMGQFVHTGLVCDLLAAVTMRSIVKWQCICLV